MKKCNIIAICNQKGGVAKTTRPDDILTYTVMWNVVFSLSMQKGAK